MATKTENKRVGRPVDPRSKRSLGLDRHHSPRKAFHAPPDLFKAMERYAKDKGLCEAVVLRMGLAGLLNEAGYYGEKKEEQ